MSFRSGANSDLLLNNLQVNGYLSLNQGFATMNVVDLNVSDQSILTNLQVTEETVLDSTLTVAGQTTLYYVDADYIYANSLSIAGATELGSLQVVGKSTLDSLYVSTTLDAGELNVASQAVIESLQVTNATTLNNLQTNGSLNVTGASQNSELQSMTLFSTMYLPNGGGVTLLSNELGYLSGVTSPLQNQINAMAPIKEPDFDGVVTAIDGLVTTGLNATTLSVSGETTLNNIVGNNLTLTGNLVVNGTITESTTSIQPTMEIISYQIGGNNGGLSGTLPLTQNVSDTTNYSVFPSIYYGYAGSSGTYNAAQTAGAISQIVISNITSSSFTWNLEKSNGDNVNIYLVFLVVYNVTGSDYPK